MKLWAECIGNIFYFKIQYLSSAAQDRTITFFQVWYKRDLSAIDQVQIWYKRELSRIAHIQIRGSTDFHFDNTEPKPKLVSKTRFRYLINNKRHYQYQIYDSQLQALYISHDDLFNWKVVESTRAFPTSDKFGNMVLMDLHFHPFFFPTYPMVICSRWHCTNLRSSQTFQTHYCK